MSISTSGNYFFQFDIAGIKDFIDESELIGFTLIEEAGNVLPTFELAFRTTNDDILSYLHEGNDFKVTFGKDRNSSIDTSLMVTRAQSTKSGDSSRLVSCVGMYSAVPYLTSSETSISTNKSALEVMRDVVGALNFTPKFNIEKSVDSQNWIQYNISGKKFVNELWMHMDLGDSFPAVGISSDGQFIVKDVVKDLGTNKAPFNTTYNWRFTKDIVNELQDIPYNGDVSIDMNTGFNNSWVGYGREKLVYNMEDGSEDSVYALGSPFMSTSNELSARMSVVKRFSATAAVNDNVHPNYWSSYQNNLVRLASFGNIRQTLSFTNLFIPIKVLDLVIFKDDDLSSNKKSSSEFNSGLYYVSKVARNISHRQLVTTVVLCRESLNRVVNNEN